MKTTILKINLALCLCASSLFASESTVTLSVDISSSFSIGQQLDFEISLENHTSNTIYIPSYAFHPLMARGALSISRAGMPLANPANPPHPMTVEGKQAYPCHTIPPGEVLRVRHDLNAFASAQMRPMYASVSLPGIYEISFSYLPTSLKGAVRSSDSWTLVVPFSKRLASPKKRFRVRKLSPEKIAEIRGDGDITGLNTASLVLLLASGDLVTWRKCSENLNALDKSPTERRRKERLVLDSLSASPSEDLRWSILQTALQSDDKRVRLDAVQALTRIPGDRASAELMRMQNSDPDEQLRTIIGNRLKRRALQPPR